MAIFFVLLTLIGLHQFQAFLKVGGRPHCSSYFDDGGIAGGSWRKLNKMAVLPYPDHADLQGFSLVAVDGTLYAAGGESKRTFMSRGRPLALRCTKLCLNNFCKYDADINKWLELPPMTSKRKAFVMVEHDMDIIAIGGSGDNNKLLEEVECFSIAENYWMQCSPLKFPVSYASAVSFAGKIVVLGTRQNLSDAFMIIQVYDPCKDEWHCVLYKPADEGIDQYSQFLTVQADMLYLVSFKTYLLGLGDEMYMLTPRVQRISLNFDLDPPVITLSTVDQEQSTIRPKNIQAFCINNQVFVCKYDHAQQVNVKKGEDGAYDLSRWQNIGYSGQGNVVPFTFDKRKLVKRIDV